MKETITIEKEVYECILRNSVKVADLEAENMQLRQFCEEFNALNIAKENQQLKELLNEIDDVYSVGINKSEDNEDEYIIYKSTFKRLDELFNKWEQMRND